jgi:hypothetical protein
MKVCVDVYRMLQVMRLPDNPKRVPAWSVISLNLKGDEFSEVLWILDHFWPALPALFRNGQYARKVAICVDDFYSDS